MAAEGGRKILIFYSFSFCKSIVKLKRMRIETVGNVECKTVLFSLSIVCRAAKAIGGRIVMVKQNNKYYSKNQNMLAVDFFSI